MFALVMTNGRMATISLKKYGQEKSDGFPFISTSAFLEYYVKTNCIDKKSARNYLKESRNPLFPLIQKGQIKREPEGFFIIDKLLADEIKNTKIDQ